MFVVVVNMKEEKEDRKGEEKEEGIVKNMMREGKRVGGNICGVCEDGKVDQRT